MARPIRVRIAGGLLLAVAASLGAMMVAGGLGASAQSNEPTISVAAPGTAVKEGGDVANIAVSATNVENLAAFEFLLLYDGDIFDYESYERGDFLGSTGREVVCQDVSETGAFKLNCITLRAAPPLGPDGSGILATVQLKPKGSGTSDLTLDRVKFAAADEEATSIVPAITNAVIAVEASSGTNWLMWGAIIGAVGIVAVGAVAFGVSRTRPGAAA